MIASRRRAGDVRFVDPLPGPIVPATDLGGVVTLKHGNLYLLSDQFGDVQPDERGLGLYSGDTRILSCSALRINGLRPLLLQASVGGNYRGTVQLTNPDFLRDEGTTAALVAGMTAARDPGTTALPDPAAKAAPGAKPRPVARAAEAAGDAQSKGDPATTPDAAAGPAVALARRSLGIQRDRILGGALLERVTIVNYSDRAVDVALDLDLASDHADMFEVRGYPRPRRGEQLPIAIDDDRITFRYAGLDGCERITYIAFSEPARVAAIPGDRGDRGDQPSAALSASWQWTIPAGGTRDLEWRVWADERPANRSRAGAARAESTAILFPEPPRVSADEGATAYRAWASSTTAVDSDNQVFNLAVKRSVADLRLLMNDGPEPGERYVAAGVPWFTTLFGRDAILTSLQLLAFRPQLAVETLTVLAARQATAVDDWRDAEPGKILHELRTGEMVRAGELPFSPYYGSVDATPLWLILLGATVDWTGDRDLLDQLWPNALAALEWIDRWGDADGDGFVEYGRRSDRGLDNQGWKDSPDSVRNRAGVVAASPIALAEVQGYVYDAKVRLAGLARLRGESTLAARLDDEAAALRARFESAFWVEDQGFYAMALDGAKRPADAIASNAGHCLWSGISAPERGRRVADRLMGPALFSGWGIRTFASGQPGYNPIGYHTGTVWPHDTSIAAAGLKRYGFHDEANRLVSSIFEAGQTFPDARLPELFCGFDRAEGATPVPYPVACSPQAWAAGSTFLFLQAMLGLSAHADRRELELLRPQLPTWLGRVTITNLRVGDAAVDLLFHRWRGATSAEVLRKVGDVSVTIRL